MQDSRYGYKTQFNNNNNKSIKQTLYNSLHTSSWQVRLKCIHTYIYIHTHKAHKIQSTMDKREYYCPSRVDLCHTSLASATNQMIGNRTSLQGELVLTKPASSPPPIPYQMGGVQVSRLRRRGPRQGGLIEIVRHIFHLRQADLDWFEWVL